MRRVTTYDMNHRYLAAGSEDGVLRIKEYQKDSEVELQEHLGPVLGVSFSHWKIGFLASCGADGKLKIYNNKSHNNWEGAYLYSSHKGPTTCVDWAPHCAKVACASADGVISIHSLNSDLKRWCVTLILNAHSGKAANTVSWSQHVDEGQMMLVSGGDDNKLKIWRDQPCCAWILTYESKDQLAPIKNVSWSPTEGFLRYAIASLTASGCIMVWNTDDFDYWNKSFVEDSDDEMYQVDFTQNGNKLIILYANNVVKLWEEDCDKMWKYLGKTKGLFTNFLNQVFSDCHNE